MLQTSYPHGFHYSVVILLLIPMLPMHISGQLDVSLDLPRFLAPIAFFTQFLVASTCLNAFVNSSAES